MPPNKAPEKSWLTASVATSCGEGAGAGVAGAGVMFTPRAMKKDTNNGVKGLNEI